MHQEEANVNLWRDGRIRRVGVVRIAEYTAGVTEHFSEYKEKLGACAECGNSPVNHTIVCTLNTVSVVLSGVFFAARKNRFIQYMENVLQRIADGMDAWHARAMQVIGAVRFKDDPTKALTYRSQVIWEEALRRGIPMQQAYFLGFPTDIYRAKPRGDAWSYFKSIPIPPAVSQSAYVWIDDKFLLKRALRDANIPTPQTRSIVTRAQARVAFEAIGAPVVAKPRAGSRGRHTTVNVRTPEDLDRACTSAQRLCRFVSIERYLEGSVCRATLVRGKLVGFFKADPPQIVGDGVSTVAELVAEKNMRKPDRMGDVVFTAEHESFIRRQGFTAESVPEQGRVVLLTHRTGRLFGGETRELLDTVHPALRAHVERVATVIPGLPVVGLDLIIRDPESDPGVQEWGIIEANSLPFIDLHYLPLYGKPSNPASAVWEMWST